MSGFNAKAARAKRPCPIWVDAFQRDTQHLEADEIGAYFLILMAMWTRESCDLPDDDVRLARVARVSVTLWKRRIGPVVREFLHVADGVVFQKRLREEAAFVEHSVGQQSKRKKGKTDDKSLKNIEPYESTDTSAEDPRRHPTQQPNNPTYDADASACAREAENPDDLTDRERVLDAMGVDRSGMIGPSRFTGSQCDVSELDRWKALPGLTMDEIEAEVRRVMARKPDGPPSRWKYFTPAMTALSAALSAPPLQPDARASPRRSSQPDLAAAMARLEAQGRA